MELKLYRADIQQIAQSVGITLNDEQAQEFMRVHGGMIEQAALKDARAGIIAVLLVKEQKAS